VIMPSAKRHTTPRHPDAPKTLGDCFDGIRLRVSQDPEELPVWVANPIGPRPCPWVGCRYHLLLHVAKDGKLSMNRPKATPGRRPGVQATPDAQWFVEQWMERAAELAMTEMEETCAFDVAAKGGMTFEEIARLLGSNKQNCQHECDGAVKKLKEGGCW